MDAFKADWNLGISGSIIAKKYGISTSGVSWRAKKLGLPLRPARGRSKVAKNTVPNVAETKKQEQKPVIAPTLRELQKKQLRADIMRVQRDYKIGKKDDGYTLINQEIMSPMVN